VTVHSRDGDIFGELLSDRSGYAAGAALAAVPLMTTQSLAQKDGEDPGPGGKCDEGLVVSKKTGKCAVPKKKGG